MLYHLGTFTHKIKKYPAVFILFLINVIVFLIISIFPYSRNYLLLDTETFMQIPWTLITVFFAHENFFHLIVNMGLLLVFGTELEINIGSKHTVSIYFLCGLIGSLIIIPFENIIQWSEPIAGASAATFGITAALSAIKPNKVLLKGKVKQWVLSLFIINIGLYFIDPAVSISVPAHAFGIIAGFIYGLYINRRKFDLRGRRDI